MDAVKILDTNLRQKPTFNIRMIWEWIIGFWIDCFFITFWNIWEIKESVICRRTKAAYVSQYINLWIYYICYFYNKTI